MMQEAQLDRRLLVLPHRPLRAGSPVLAGVGPGLAARSQVHEPADVGGREQPAGGCVLQRPGQHGALGTAQPDHEGDERGEAGRHHGQVDRGELLKATDGGGVPEAMGEHSHQVPSQGRQHAHQRPTAADRDAHADAGERGEERVGERADQAADHEGGRQRLGAARAQAVGAVVRGRQVEDVLDEGEPDADHARVDDSVEDAVQLRPAPPQQEQQEQALGGLLGDRGDDGEHLGVVEPAEQPTEALQHQRGGGGDEGPPQHARGQQRARLRLVAVQPQEHPHHGSHRQERQHRGQGQRRGCSGERDHQQHRGRAQQRQQRDHEREGSALATVAGHGRQPNGA